MSGVKIRVPCDPTCSSVLASPSRSSGIITASRAVCAEVISAFDAP